MIIDKDFDAEQTQATVHMLLVEKGGYTTVAQNIPEVTGDAESLVKKFRAGKQLISLSGITILISVLLL